MSSIKPPVDLPTPFVKSGTYGSSSDTVCLEIDPMGKVVHLEEVPITFPPVPIPEPGDSGVTAGTYGTPVRVPSFTVDTKGRVTDAFENALPVVTGDLSGSYPELDLTPTGVVAGDYGSGNLIPVISVDAKGRLTDVSNVSIAFPDATGDLEGIYPNLTLTETGVTPGSYGSGSLVPVVTIDSSGRVTSVTSSPLGPTIPSGPAGGDLTGNYPSPSLVAVGVTPGSYGSGGLIPSLTVDSKGRITNIATVAVSSTSPSGVAGGDLTGSYPNPVLVAVGTPGTYGSGSLIPVITVDSKGRVSSVTTNALGSTTPSGSAGGDLTGSYPNPSLVSLGVTPGTYGSGTLVPSLTIDAKGRVTGVSTVAVSSTTPAGAAGGDLSGSYPNPTLVTTGVVANTYGSGSLVPVITVDSKGRLTSVTTSALGSTVPSGSAGGDLTGSYPNPTLVSLGVAPGTYGSATLIPSLTIDAKGRVTSVATIALGAATPSGSAGGDLSGTYPNPSLATVAVTPGVYTNSTVTVDSKGRVIAAASGSAPAAPSLSAVVGVGNTTGGDITINGNLTLTGSIIVPGSVTLGGTNVASLTLANGAGCMRGTIKFTITILSAWTVTLTFSVARPDTNYICLVGPPTGGTSGERNTWVSIGSQVFCTAKTTTSVTISGVAILALGFPAPMSFDYIVL